MTPGMFFGGVASAVPKKKPTNALNALEMSEAERGARVSTIRSKLPRRKALLSALKRVPVKIW